MAYGPSKTSALQTAANVAVTLVAAELGAGLLTSREDVDARFTEVKDNLATELFASVAEEQAAAPSSGGGNVSNPVRGASPFTLDEAKATVLNFGAFKGLTLGDVVNITPEEAVGYGYVDKQGKGKPGLQWVKWAAKNEEPKAAFIRVRAAAIVDALGLATTMPGDAAHTLNKLAQ